MLIPRPTDTIHKAWMYRVLTAIADDNLLSHTLYFKGGTCAAMRGFLNRFSVDLDFDARIEKKEVNAVREHIASFVNDLGLTVKDQSKVGVQYFLKYPSDEHARNTIKVDVLFPPPHENQYEPVYLSEIDRTMMCQTQETMFANKLVAVIDRFEKTGAIAGRDIYDIHAFFLQGFRYRPEIIQERRGTSAVAFFKQLIAFIDERVTLTIITQDLSTLLESKEFQNARKFLKTETLRFLKDEVRRLKG